MSDQVARLNVALEGRYVIERELRRGGMSRVYLAADLRHQRDVAFKVLAEDVSRAATPDRFLREIRITARLSHPNIRPLLDSGEADGLLFYAMPLSQGISLQERMTEGPLPLGEAVSVAAEVADGLAHAHSHDIVHRDIKPSNLMLEGGHVVIGDFGVSLGLVPALSKRMTAAETVLGTAAYMSPEQCSGVEDVDGRSDLYSLGCVLYEMLCGEAPFGGDTPLAIVAKHLVEPLPPLPDEVPVAVQNVLRRALEKSPEDRYQTAEEMAGALRGALVDHQNETRPGIASVVGWTVAAVLVGLMTTVAISGFESSRNAGLDPALYMVLPFQHRGDARPDLIDGDRCETLIHESLGRWSDIRVTDLLVVNDLMARHGGPPANLTEALAKARAVGAGRVIWGTIWDAPDGPRVQGVLYDPAHPRVPLRRSTIALAGDHQNIRVQFDAMVDSLLLGEASTLAALEGASGTRSLSAWAAYEVGHEWLEQWKLSEAGDHFARAVELDPQYAQASLWRALVGAFGGEAFQDWRPFASMAAENGGGLSSKDLRLARALTHLADGRWPQACEAFEDLTRQDPLSFAPWFGLGECQAMDLGVIPDSTSPSGFAFRTSYEAAKNSYMRALRLVPSFNLVLQDSSVARLQRILPGRSTQFRIGHLLDPDTSWFGSFAAYAGDSLAFVPYPLELVLQDEGYPVPTTTQRAIDRNLGILHEITLEWLEDFPNEPKAAASHAGSLESLGRVAPTGDPQTSALDAIRHARTVAVSREDSVRFRATHARLLVKAYEFEAAALLADSVIVGSRTATGPAAQEAAGFAALLGRVHLAADIIRRAPDQFVHDPRFQPVRVPGPVLRAARIYHTYAAVGGPLDSIHTTRARTLSTLRGLVPPERQAALAEALFMWSDVLAFSTAGPREVHRVTSWDFGPLTVQSRLAAGDMEGARRLLTELEATRESIAVADIVLSGVFLEGRSRLMAGDTAGAVDILERGLAGLPRSAPSLISKMEDAVAMVRAMALRAEVAAVQGDTASYSRWREPLSALWGSGDAYPRSVLQRLDSLAASTISPPPSQPT